MCCPPLPHDRQAVCVQACWLEFAWQEVARYVSIKLLVLAQPLGWGTGAWCARISSLCRDVHHGSRRHRPPAMGRCHHHQQAWTRGNPYAGG